MFGSVLIANRGEISRRIQRTARTLGVRTIAVYSQADAAMPFVREADDAICVGPAPARDSYLNVERVLDAARRSGAEAIHPGYGFLSENGDFAAAVQAAGLVWIGAPPAAIRAMGRKDAAKRLMMAAGVAVTPGYLGDDQNERRLAAEAAAIGYPVLIKAVAGGGGKGMRKVDAAPDFEAALASCRREAAAAFGDDRVLIEKYIDMPRHIEVQVFGDSHGHIVHLFERDCSLQRRHQKVIEEAPAPGLDEPTRTALVAMALKAARAVDYVGAGTVEFIADAGEGLRADRIWFMEMNTRLQVEHPVTEAITGQDLVAWQFRIAAGERLPLGQEQITRTGWAMEARLYAENPATGFLPSIGRLDHLRLPGTGRVDSGVEAGDEISPHYDPMIAKIIAHGASRAAAAARLADACAAVEVWPVRTNAAFLVRVARNSDFLAGAIDTGFLARHAELAADEAPSEAVLQAAAQALLPAGNGDPWTELTGFRMAAPAEPGVMVAVADACYIARLDPGAERARVAVVQGERIAFRSGQAWLVGAPRPDRTAATDHASDGVVMAPMPGCVLSVGVKAGDQVVRGQVLMVLEAMKMEYSLTAPCAGIIEQLRAEAGQQVIEGSTLARIAGVAE
jgi:3-methylcrotonyl-CoA carboxylase alpha subunit